MPLRVPDASSAGCAAHLDGRGASEVAVRCVARTLVGCASVSVVVSPPASYVIAPGKAKLLDLPNELLVLLLGWLDARNLVRVAATCPKLYYEPMASVEVVLRQRAASRGRACPESLPLGSSSWAAHLAWLEHRRDEAWAPVAAGICSSFFLSDGGRLICCGVEGNGLCGALGHGELDGVDRVISQLDGNDRVVPVPTPLPSVVALRMGSVSAGSGYTAAVSVGGMVFTWGTGNNGCLGHCELDGYSPVPKQVQALAGHRALSVSTGAYHVLVVTEAGAVFSWGADDSGQCGHGIRRPNQVLPRCVDSLAGVMVRSASAGSDHSFVVTECGSLYSFGAGYSGLLGHDTTDQVLSPMLVGALRDTHIVAAAAGLYHALALADDGTVFAWGWNSDGELGIGRIGRRTLLPDRVRSLCGIRVRSVTAGSRTSAAVTASGQLFTWGEGQFGQLGHDSILNERAPRRVELLQGACDFVVSGNDHTLVVMCDGSVFGWGRARGLGFPEDIVDRVLMCTFPRRYPNFSCRRTI